MAIKKGRFITFEGSEGSGKSTQARLLCEYLKKRKLPIVFVREPGTTVVGEKIREILLDPKNKNILPISEMLLYMVARAEFVAYVVKPALDKGKIVISDRFIDSTLAYQGYGLGIDLKRIDQVGKLVCQGIFPELTILLDVTSEEGLRRRGRKRDRIERRKMAYHRKVRFGYLKIAKNEPGRVKVINVDKNSIEETQCLVRKTINKFLCL